MIFDNVDDITQQQLQQQKQTNEQTEKDSYDNKLERKIAIATQGIIDYAVRKLRRLGVQSQGKRTAAASTIGRQNIETICNHLIAVNAEINPSIMYKINKLQVLCLLSEFHNNQKSFLQMTRNDILDYLDNLCRPEASDPEHKWIGTYNLRRIYFLRFFKWLYNPDLNPKDRPIPDVMKNIRMLKRMEHSTVKPTDLWTAEDDVLFLKYCPNKRDKAYHTIARDSSCRPSEILNLRIRDVVFMTSGTSQYVQIVVNGKTGNRSIPLFSAVPYIKDWIDDHPQGRNPNAFLIPSLDRKHRKFGNRMKEKSLNIIYRKHNLEFFPKLLEDPKYT
jgi:integrase/recombinase XerD